MPAIGAFQVSTLTDGPEFQSFAGDHLTFFKMDVKSADWPNFGRIADNIQAYEATRAEQKASGVGNPKALADKFKFNPFDMSLKIKIPAM